MLGCSENLETWAHKCLVCFLCACGMLVHDMDSCHCLGMPILYFSPSNGQIHNSDRGCGPLPSGPSNSWLRLCIDAVKMCLLLKTLMWGPSIPFFLHSQSSIRSQANVVSTIRLQFSKLCMWAHIIVLVERSKPVLSASVTQKTVERYKVFPATFIKWILLIQC